jgi:hypothetical protein
MIVYAVNPEGLTDGRNIMFHEGEVLRDLGPELSHLVKKDEGGDEQKVEEERDERDEELIVHYTSDRPRFPIKTT